MIGDGGFSDGLQYQRSDNGKYETAQYNVEYIAPNASQLGGLKGTIYRQHILYTTPILGSALAVVASLGTGSHVITHHLGAVDTNFGWVRPLPYAHNLSIIYNIGFEFHPTNGECVVETGSGMPLSTVVGYIDYYKD